MFKVLKIGIVIIGFLIGWFILGPMLVKAESLDCNTHKLYCKIVEFNPRIDRAEAMNLSNKIYSKAKAAGIDPSISLAILLQESGLNNINTYKTYKTIESFCKDKKCFKIITEINEVWDMSLAQININTANDNNFDIERLYKGDIDYALDCHIIILKEKMNMCKNEKYPWACYHSVNEPYKSVYIDLVKRFL